LEGSLQISTLYKSPLLRVEDVRCPGPQVAGWREERSLRHEIVLLRSGAFIRHDASGKFLADANTLLFFNAGQPYHVSHPLPGGDRCTVFSLKPQALLELVLSLDPSAGERPERPFARGYAVLQAPFQLIQYSLARPSELSRADPLEVEEILILQLGAALQQALGQSAKPARKAARTATTREHRELVQAARMVLGERFDQPLRLSDLAGAVFTSPFHLCRVFKQQTGTSLHRYLLHLRLGRALDLLAEEPTLPLARMALDLGFASHNHFTTAFRQTFGLTPAQFRQSAANSSLREMRKILEARTSLLH
jgi:AraC-like DNA-binding protein